MSGHAGMTLWAERRCAGTKEDKDPSGETGGDRIQDIS